MSFYNLPEPSMSFCKLQWVWVKWIINRTQNYAQRSANNWSCYLDRLAGCCVQWWVWLTSRMSSSEAGWLGERGVELLTGARLPCPGPLPAYRQAQDGLDGGAAHGALLQLGTAHLHTGISTPATRLNYQQLNRFGQMLAIPDRSRGGCKAAAGCRPDCCSIDCTRSP